LRRDIEEGLEELPWEYFAFENLPVSLVSRKQPQQRR